VSINDDVSDVFIRELKEISDRYYWVLHWHTLCKLNNVVKDYKKPGNQNNLKGKLGEVYTTNEYVYPSIRKIGISNNDYYIEHRYDGGRGRGDIDFYLKLYSDVCIGKVYLGEVKNFNDTYDVFPDKFEELILDRFERTDKRHNHQWILFLSRYHLNKILDECKDNDITPIPVSLYLDKNSLKELTKLFIETAHNNNLDCWNDNIALSVLNNNSLLKTEIN